MAEISVFFYADREGIHFQIFEIRKLKKYFRVSDPQFKAINNYSYICFPKMYTGELNTYTINSLICNLTFNIDLSFHNALGLRR